MVNNNNGNMVNQPDTRSIAVKSRQMYWSPTQRSSILKKAINKTSKAPSKLSFKLETTYRNVRKKSSGKSPSISNRTNADDTPPDGVSQRKASTPREGQMNRWVNSVLGVTKSRRQLRDRVEQAIQDGKIFINLGQCECVQRALLKRGWVEKPCSDISWKLISSKTLEDDAYRQKYASAAWAHQILQKCTPNLIWNHSGQVMSWRDIQDNQYVNQSPGPKIAFTSKDGLAYCLEGSQWFQDGKEVCVNFPRSYNLLLSDAKAVFMSDYCLTACIGTLKIFLAKYDQEGFPGLFGDGEGTFEWGWIDFALHQIQHYCRVRNHEDIDGGLVAPPNTPLRWDLFLTQYYELIGSDVKFMPLTMEDTQRKINRTKATLENLSVYWPQMNVYGTNNVWICKPGSRCRGRGIIIYNRIEKILEVEKSTSFKEIDSSWIVQKYIERPLLIHGIKFDIRQWFLVSCWNPLTVWFYKDCYLRFCSRPFTLDNFHESIHLCNTAVQTKYAHLRRRQNSPIPLDNIWEKTTFKQYLKNIGMEEMWSEKIYPGMKKGLLGVILPSQELHLESGTTKIRKNSFELYGADFLISEDFVPWLIEVNATPMLQSPSPKFKKMTRQCLEDCMKVVLDWREDRTADTGRFELIYEQSDPLTRYIQVGKGEIAVVGVSLNKPGGSGKIKGGKKPVPTKSAKLQLKARTLSSKMLAAVNPSLLALKLRKTLVNLFSNCNGVSSRAIARSKPRKDRRFFVDSNLEARELLVEDETPCVTPVVTEDVSANIQIPQSEQSTPLSLLCANRRLSARSTPGAVSTSSVTPGQSVAKTTVSAQLPGASEHASRRSFVLSSLPLAPVSDTCVKWYSLKTIVSDVKRDDNKNNPV